MPKVSFYELEHMSEDTNFEKVRSKKHKTKEAKHPDKKSHREKKLEI